MHKYPALSTSEASSHQSLRHDKSFVNVINNNPHTKNHHIYGYKNYMGHRESIFNHPINIFCAEKEVCQKENLSKRCSEK